MCLGGAAKQQSGVHPCQREHFKHIPVGAVRLGHRQGLGWGEEGFRVMLYPGPMQHSRQGPLRESTWVGHEQRDKADVDKCLYCGFFWKESARWGRLTEDWLPVFESGSQGNSCSLWVLQCARFKASLRLGNLQAAESQLVDLR